MKSFFILSLFLAFPCIAANAKDLKKDHLKKDHLDKKDPHAPEVGHEEEVVVDQEKKAE